MKANNVIKILKKNDLELTNSKELTLLYLPLIGVNAYALYNLLASLDEKTYPSLFFTEHLGLTITKINEALTYLEASFLITTYQNRTNDNELLLCVNNPMSAQSFRNNELFIANLLAKLNNNTSSIEYIFERFNYSEVNYDKYVNISKTFMDAFKCIELDDRLNNDEFKKVQKIPTIKDYFNYDHFIKLIPRDLVRANQLLFSDDYERKIFQLAFAYQLTEAELAQIYLDLVKHNKNVTIEILKDQITLYVKDKTTNHKDSDANTLDELSAIELVKIIGNNGVDLNQNELAIVSDFHLRHPDIKKGILNSLVMFIYKMKDHKLPNVNYLDKVLNDWLIKKNINTTSDAINFLNNYENFENKEITHKTYKPNKKTSSVKVPEESRAERTRWFDEMVDYIKSIPDGGDLD